MAWLWSLFYLALFLASFALALPDDLALVIRGGLLVSAFLSPLAPLLRRERRETDPLDEPLLHWTPLDPFTKRHLLTSVICLGRTGSAKTSGAGKTLMRAILRKPEIGGILLCAKPEDADDVRKLLDEAGREALWFGPKHPLRLNVVDHIMATGDIRQCVEFITTVGETFLAKSGKGGENDKFWDSMNEMTLYHAIQVVKLGIGKVSIPDVQRFISDAATSLEQLSDPTWRSGFHNETMKAAHNAPKSSAEKWDFEQAKLYWLKDWPAMDHKTRANVLAGVVSVLFTFNSGNVRELLSSDTNFDFSEVRRGRWLIVETPPCKMGKAGVLVSASLKWLLQQDVLKQTADKYITVTWTDEASQFCNRFDTVYMSQSRSHKGCCVFLTQDTHGLATILDKNGGNDAAMGLVSQFGTRIIHALGSPEDAELVSKWLGRSLQQFLGGSVSPAQDVHDELFAQGRYSANSSSQFENVIEPAVFMNNLRTGGPATFLADAFVLKSGEPFSSGANACFVTFDQRRGNVWTR